jgi:hypothetical protein
LFFCEMGSLATPQDREVATVFHKLIKARSGLPPAFDVRVFEAGMWSSVHLLNRNASMLTDAIERPYTHRTCCSAGRRVAASEVDLVVTRDSERANALRAIPCVYELNPVAFIP